LIMWRFTVWRRKARFASWSIFVCKTWSELTAHHKKNPTKDHINLISKGVLVRQGWCSVPWIALQDHPFMQCFRTWRTMTLADDNSFEQPRTASAVTRNIMWPSIFSKVRRETWRDYTWWLIWWRSNDENPPINNLIPNNWLVEMCQKKTMKTNVQVSWPGGV
jgi:hypothetical protein